MRGRVVWAYLALTFVSVLLIALLNPGTRHHVWGLTGGCAIVWGALFIRVIFDKAAKRPMGVFVILTAVFTGLLAWLLPGLHGDAVGGLLAVAAIAAFLLTLRFGRE